MARCRVPPCSGALGGGWPEAATSAGLAAAVPRPGSLHPLAHAAPATTPRCSALTSLTSVDFDLEELPSHLLEALASLPRLQSVGLQAWELPTGDSGAWQQMAVLGSRLCSLRLKLGDDIDPAAIVLPPGLLALTAASGIHLNVYPDWHQGSLPGLDRLPGVDTIAAWSTCNAPELWRCRNLRSLQFNNATGWLPPDVQPEAHLTGLTHLSLGCANFAGGRLPPALCDLPRLRRLDISHSRPSKLALPPQVSRLAMLKHLSLGRLTLSAESCATLASIPALTVLRFSGALGVWRVARCLCCSTAKAARPLRPAMHHLSPTLPAECTLPALPAGSHLPMLRELWLLASTVGGEELPPPSIAGASQLTALRCSLHTLSPEALRARWPTFLATLQGLPNLQARGGGATRSPAAAAVACRAPPWHAGCPSCAHPPSHAGH